MGETSLGWKEGEAMRVRIGPKIFRGHFLISLLVLLLLGAVFSSSGHAFTLNVVDADNVPIPGFRWLVEEDNTVLTVPGAQVTDSISMSIHNSHAPVVASGSGASSGAIIDVPADKRYFVTVLADGPAYAISGTTVGIGQDTVTVTVNKLPVPTAQIYLKAFVDHNPINNAIDEREDGLGGCGVILADFSGGQLLYDAFGNFLGTTYQTDANGQPVLDAGGNPIVDQLGNGMIKTLSQADIDAGNNPLNLKVGEALIKNLAPGKIGIRVIPPALDDSGNPVEFVLTSTIEGTPTVDAWVKANEPMLFVEGFGTGVWHAFFGFVKVSPLTPSTIEGQVVKHLQMNVLNGAGNPAGTGTITGTVRYNHFDRPPNNQGRHAGPIVEDCWVGLNDAVLIAEVELVPLVEPPAEVIDALKPAAGLYAAQCNADGTFTINGVPPGDYQIVTWDTPLDSLFGTHKVTVPPGTGGTGGAVDVGDLLTMRWFGTLEGTVFYDTNQNGIQDAGEQGISQQAVNLRFRDGSVYQAAASGGDGKYALKEVFPFFKWLVAEVDFARFKATGMTTAVDYGGAIPDLLSPVWPSNGNKSLQPQDPLDPFNENGTVGYRTETGQVLTEAVHLFLNQTNLIDWGKVNYAPGENGGISGIVFYDTTRAEDDPRYNAGEPWQPGIPRVQVNLYADGDFDNPPYGNFPGPEDVDRNGDTVFDVSDGIIDDLDGNGVVTLADVDNYPFGWSTGGPMGLEDVDWNGNGLFDLGDALEFTTTDSWDDNKPSGCVQDLPIIYGTPIPECADTYGTWNQVRPGIFDGGYAFGPNLPNGNYIVEAAAPPYLQIVRSSDKNVDFGETFIPSTLKLPPVCVGDPYVVPDELTLFPGVAANLAGQTLNHCDRKQVGVIDASNSAADFFMFTEVPKAARVVGFANNDLGAEFNQASPIYGEKLGAPWIPISFRDWAGRELVRVYADEFGHYNALIPSTYSINVPSPSGVAPNMITMVLNDPVKADGTIDPWYNPDYSVTPWTFNYQPGTTTYTDTPLVPLAAFTTAETRLDTYQVDGGPVIGEVFAATAGAGTGPVVTANNLPAQVTITCLGNTEILNPAYDPTAQTPAPQMITRDYGCGNVQGTVTLDGVPLAVTNWTNDQITVTVTAAMATGADGVLTGQLAIVRGDNGIATDLGVTLHVVDPSTAILRVPGQYPTIQAAVDAAPYTPDALGALILVAPGTYNENVIMYKPVRLQGAGAGSTFINGNPTPLERLDAWHARIELPVAQGGLNGQVFENFALKNVFSENEAPCIIVFGEQYFPDGTIQNTGANPMANVFNPGYRFGTADNYSDINNPVAGQAIYGQAIIDGFTLSGSKAGGGVYAVMRARGLQISNNEITNNQGNYAGGISIGVPDVGFQMFDEPDFRTPTSGIQNTDVIIVNNKIHKNGGFQGAGGIAFGEDSHRYIVESNLITGNHSRYHGGGIAHIGQSNDGSIRWNRILFNENFFGAILQRAGDGGGIYVGGDIAGGTGSGSVTIEGNLIQGNLTGSGQGGGIRANAVSGADVRAINGADAICTASADCPNPWPLFTLTIVNNIIVDNVAGLGGAGISLQDVSRSVIVNNTVANNDSTSTGSLAFPAGSLSSVALPSGVISHPHSTVLQNLWQLAAAQPLNLTAGKVLEYCIQGHSMEDPLNPNPAECAGTPELVYSDPNLRNNIVWHNRSWFFDATAVDPGTGGLVGALAPNPTSPYWDLGITGAGGAGLFLNPQNNILSSLADPAGGTTYNGTNIAANPNFVSEYVNLLQTATVIDENGNNVNVRYTPLELGTSDYHINSPSPAMNAGAAIGFLGITALAADYDGENRDLNTPDIGADEVAGGVAADAVTIVSATYNAAADTLEIVATSSQQPNVQLTAAGYGALGWKSWLNFYRTTFTGVVSRPASVTVTSSGGGTATYTLPVTETVTITSVIYNAAADTLEVVATSSEQPNVQLTAVGYGALGWKSWLNLYRTTFTGVTTQPASVTVTSSGGGSETFILPPPVTDTVNIQSLTYSAASGGTLTVVATSSDQPTVSLTAQGYGALGWKSWLNFYRTTFTGIGPKPANVTVNSSGGGTATVAVP
ncbi:MAG: hypothetical protein C4576_16885 [Desulfobacteraceae bacterium]|nr:MAG: hypothetical protein C4576_16885 [Desulfobacteraceae bacterium]